MRVFILVNIPKNTIFSCGNTAEADLKLVAFRPHWQEKSFLPKQLAFIWADTLGQAVYFMNSTCMYVPMPLCLCGRVQLSVCWTLKNFKMNIITSCLQLW